MEFPQPRPSKYPVRVARSAAGLGLCAQSDIPKNRFIIEYWGEIVDDKTADKINGRYLFDIGDGKTISGGTRKNVARYINHACRPNCEARQVEDRVYIFSIRPIKAGEELTYDYGKEYVDTFIKPNCSCKTCVLKRKNRK